MASRLALPYSSMQLQLLLMEKVSAGLLVHGRLGHDAIERGVRLIVRRVLHVIVEDAHRRLQRYVIAQLLLFLV